MPVQRFADPGNTDALSALLHDRWFAVTRIREDGGDLVIPFASVYVKRARKAMFDSTLCIGHVQSWRVLDTEKIEIYDFAYLTFDEALGCLRIEGNIPVTVEVKVSGFSVTVTMP
jgi:hypothetical protein